MTSKSQECSSCDLCNVDLGSIQEQLEHDFSLIHHMKLHQKHKKLVHLCSLCGCEVGPIKSYVTHLHGSKHQKTLKTRKEQWSVSPPTEDDLGRRFHVKHAERHQTRFRNSSSNKSARDNQWDNNSPVPQNFDRNFSNKFDNTSKKNQYRGAQNFSYHNFSARNQNTYPNHAPYRYGQAWNFDNGSNRMQNNQNWKHGFHGNFNTNFRGPWNQQQYAEDPSYNSWNMNPQYSTWGENLNWNNNCNSSAESSVLPNHSADNDSMIPEGSGNFKEHVNETVPQSTSTLNQSNLKKIPKESATINQSVLKKAHKDSADKDPAKKKHLGKMSPKVKKMVNKKLSSSAVQPEQHRQETGDASDFCSESENKKCAVKNPATIKVQNITEMDNSDTNVSELSKVSTLSKAKSESVGKQIKIKGKKKSNRRHMYFLSSDSDSDPPKSGISSDASESAIDGSPLEKLKEDSFNKAILNRLINFPCTRKQQLQLAKWIQEHSKLKKKLLFPRFNLQLVPPDCNETEQVELRRVLSEMMTELPGEAIDALVDVLKLDSNALPQEELAEALLLPEDSAEQGQVPAQSSDLFAPDSPKPEGSTEQNLTNIAIKPDPDGMESSSNEYMQPCLSEISFKDINSPSVKHSEQEFSLSCGRKATTTEQSSENRKGSSVSVSSLFSSSAPSENDAYHNTSSFATSLAEKNVHNELHAVNGSPQNTSSVLKTKWPGPEQNGVPVQSSGAMSKDHSYVNSNLQNPTSSLRSNLDVSDVDTGTGQGSGLVTKDHSYVKNKNLSSLKKPPNSPQVPLGTSEMLSSNGDEAKLGSLTNEQSNVCSPMVDHLLKDSFVFEENKQHSDEQCENARPDSCPSIPESGLRPPSHEFPDNFSPLSAQNPPGEQKWTEMPSWFQKPTPEFFQSDYPNTSEPSNGSSAEAHNLVDKLLNLSKDEEKLREQSQKVEQVIGQMYKVLEEWKQKRSELHQEEIELRKQRVNLLEMLQGSLSTDTKVGSTSSTPKSDAPADKDTDPSNKDQNVTYLGTLDSTWDIIQQLGLSMPSTSDSNWFDTPDLLKVTKVKKKNNSKAPQKKKGSVVTENTETKGKRTAKSTSSAKSKKRKSFDGKDSSEAGAKVQKKMKHKRNSAAEQANILQDLLNHIVKRDTKSPKSQNKTVHERAADSTSEDMPSSSTPARPSVIKTEAIVADTFGPLEVHGSSILDIKVSNGFMYTCSSDKTAKCIEIKNPSNCIQFKGHEKTVSSVQLVPCEDGVERVFTTSHDGYLRCFDPQNGNLIKEQYAGSSILCVAKGFGNLYLGLNNGQVWPYRISSGKFLDAFDFSHMSINRIAAGREGGQRLLCVVAYDGSVSIRNAISGLFIRLLDIKAQPPCHLQIDNTEVFLTTTDRSIFIFNLTSGLMLKRILCVSAATGLYAIRNLMLVCCFDGLIRCYNRKNWSLNKVYYGAGKTMAMCLEVSDGWIFSGNRHGIVEAFKTDHSVDAKCWFQDCKTPFGQWKDLKHHLLADHIARVYPDTVSTWSKCPWVKCQHLLKGITGQEKLQELEDHILEHAESVV